MKKEKMPVSAEMLGEEEGVFTSKKNKIRLIAFIAAVAVSVGSIAFAVYRIGYREPGAYTIAPDIDGSLPYYSSGVSLVCNFTQSSGEIRAKMNEIKGVYTDLLKRSYKMLDCEKEYSDTPNIASINANIGSEVAVSEELLTILEDAYSKTRENVGYSMFAGAINAYRDSLVYGFEPQENDPINDPQAASTISELNELIYKSGTFTLTLDKRNMTAKLTVSDEFSDYIGQNGIDSPIIDLGLLKDAYRVGFIADGLEKSGCTDGYIVTESGISVSLSDNSDIRFCFYGLGNDETGIIAFRQCGGGSSAALVRTFALYEGEPGFYTVESDGKTVYRSRYMPDFSTDRCVEQVLVSGSGTNTADKAYLCLLMLTCSDPREAIATARSSGADILFTLEGRDNKIYASSKDGLIVADGYEVVYD